MENQELKIQKNPEQALLERLEQLLPDQDPAKLAEGFDALIQAHTEADLVALCADPLFLQFASGRRDPLDVLYDSYQQFSEVLKQEIERQVQARTQRTTATASARTSAPSAGLNQAQIATLAEWNRAYPEYAMTTREYAAMLKNI